MHVSTNIVNTKWLKVYGYEYGMICFDTRFWSFTQHKENSLSHDQKAEIPWDSTALVQVIARFALNA